MRFSIIGYQFFVVLTLVALPSFKGGREWYFPKAENRPEARSNAGMCFVPNGSESYVLLHGGIDRNGKILSDTWKWNGLIWEEFFLGTSPFPCTNFVLVYDEERKRVVRFGGFSEKEGLSNATWVCDGVTWEKLLPIDAPSPRCMAAGVFNSKTRSVYLFGGSMGTRYSDEMWAWDGENWAQISDLIPQGRAQHAMAYDEDRDKIVLYGGLGRDPGSRKIELFTDTWEFDGKTWDLKKTKKSPPAVFAHSMVYHRDAGLIIQFSGFNEKSEAQNSTWGWDGKQWKEIPFKENDLPAPRVYPAVAYDKVRERTVVFGGIYVTEPTDLMSELAWR